MLNLACAFSLMRSRRGERERDEVSNLPRLPRGSVEGRRTLRRRWRERGMWPSAPKQIKSRRRMHTKEKGTDNRRAQKKHAHTNGGAQIEEGENSV